MIRNRRNLVLDVFDYAGNKVCPLYDSTSDVSGQAVDVFVITERNGWRELSFMIPSKCSTENGEEDNFRLRYLVGDYRIRLIDDDGIDWFQISEPEVTHNAFSKNVQVTAGHISQLLKTKNLGLEFTDKAGNNIGTAEQLLTTVLEGTGWSVGDVSTFYEKDNKTEKKRTLKASAKTGAFKLITKICDLFEAKPVFHGEGRTVDIVPINPFSKPADSGMPDISKADGVIELHYGQNVKNVKRKLNTENLITKLYAYGSYGDDVSGYCGIDEIEYKVAQIRLTSDIEAGHRYYFSVNDTSDISVKYSFVPCDNLSANTVQDFSQLDYASMLYVWNDTEKKAYRVDKKAEGDELPCRIEYVFKRNYFSFIMNFDYYSQTGLLTDDALQAIAEYQVNGQQLKENILAKTTEMNECQLILSETVGNVDFCKLNVSSVALADSYQTLTLSGNPDDLGVLYRTDFDAQKKDRFKWRVSKGVKPTGESVNDEASVIYIAHNTDPITWEKAYIKNIENKNEEIILTLWASADTNIYVDDRFYLFSTNNMNGYFGAYETADESCKITLENAVKVVTTNHPVYFSKQNPIISADELNGYGWWCKYYDDSTPSELYFCYYGAGDNGWNRTYCSDSAPAINNGSYWFNWKTATLHYCIDGAWKKVVISEEKPLYDEDYKLYFNTKLVESFSIVYNAMITRDKYYKGQNELLTVEIKNTLPSGNYYIEDKYGTFFLFTTDRQLKYGDKVVYNTTESHVVQTASGVDKIIEAKGYRFDNVKYHSNNILSSAYITSGSLDSSGVEVDNASKARTGFVVVYPGVYNVYNSSGLVVQFYSKSNQFVSSVETSNSFTVNENIAYIRVTADKDLLTNDTVIQHAKYQNSVIAEKTTYVRIGDNVGSGELKGLVPLMEKFVKYADLTYGDKKAAVEVAQDEFRQLECDMIDSQGDIYREGYWQTEDYVEGDETKLYDDAMENQKELAKPSATYSISYLDRYDSQEQSEAEESRNVLWPDLSIMSAAHLVDPDIDVNCWAYLDKVAKCYDQPQKTTIAINTNLSTIGQHTFKDVLTHIAEVANTVKGKETLYSRASAISSSGQMAAERLEGKIDANKLRITGGSSTWYTDNRGNQVFESSDGSSAMTQTGNGFAIANSKNIWGEWNWRTFGTGEGFTADEIIAGYLSAERIEAGSITVDHLSSSVGNELNIASNKAQNLYATIDGQKPAGAILTNGSHIEIATDYINVASTGRIALNGGKIKVNGGTVDINGQSSVNVASQGIVDINGSLVTVRSGGKVNIESGSIDVSADGKINVTSGESIIIGKGTLKSNLDEKYTIFTGVSIDTDGVTVSGKTIKQLTDSGATGIILLGSEKNKLTSNGVLSLAGGSILLDGPSNIATIGNDGGTVNIGATGKGVVNIGTSGSATINLATYNIKSDTKSTAYDSTYATGGVASTVSQTNKIEYTKTDDDGNESATSFTITSQYTSAVITSNANPSIVDGKLLQQVYQNKGLNMYADTVNSRTILSPSVTDGNLLGWNVVSAKNVGAENVSATMLCADNMYVSGIAVADQKWTIDTIARILNNNDVIPNIKSRADRAYWGAYRKPELILSESNGLYTLKIKTAGGESNSVNFNRADTNVSVGTDGDGFVYPKDGNGSQIGDNKLSVSADTEGSLSGYDSVTSVPVWFDILLRNTDVIREKSFTLVDMTPLYEDGKDVGANSVGFMSYTSGEGVLTPKQTNGKTQTYYCTASKPDENGYISILVSDSAYGGGSALMTVDTKDVFNSVTLSASGWVNGIYTIEASNKEKAHVIAPNVTQKETWNDDVVTVNATFQGINKGTLDIDMSAILSDARTIAANSVFFSGFTAASGKLTALLSTAKQKTYFFSTGTKDSNGNIPILVNDSGASGGTTLMTVDISNEYKNGYAEGWAAAKAKIVRIDNVIQGPSDTVDKQENLFEITAGAKAKVVKAATGYYIAYADAYAYVNDVLFAQASDQCDHYC